MSIDFLSIECMREQTRDWEAERSFWVAEQGRYVKRVEARDRLGLSTLLGEVGQRSNSWTGQQCASS